MILETYLVVPFLLLLHSSTIASRPLPSSTTSARRQSIKAVGANAGPSTPSSFSNARAEAVANAKKERRQEAKLLERSRQKHERYVERLKYLGRGRRDRLPAWSRYNDSDLIKKGEVTEDSPYFASTDRSQYRDVKGSDPLLLSQTVEPGLDEESRKVQLRKMYYERTAMKLTIMELPAKVRLPERIRSMRVEVLQRKVDEAGGPRNFLGHEEYDALLATSLAEYNESRRANRGKKNLLERAYGSYDDAPEYVRKMTVREIEDLTGIKAHTHTELARLASEGKARKGVHRPEKEQDERVDDQEDETRTAEEQEEGEIVEKKNRKMKAKMEETRKWKSIDEIYNGERASSSRQSKAKGTEDGGKIGNGSKTSKKGAPRRSWFQDIFG
jgi:hypothetical protein